MNQIVLVDEKIGEDGRRLLTAEVTDEGDLVIAGCDSGEIVKKFWGDFDYEYWVTVKARDVPMVLLRLLKEKRRNDVDFRAWLAHHPIPSEFQSWV